MENTALMGYEDNTETGRTFSYNYSTERQEEVKSIRQRYAPREESKMDQLRNLDKSTKNPGTVVSLSIGIVSSLLFGAGMACVMEWPTELFITGLALGVAGMVGMILSYPIYATITKKRRKKLAPQIIELSDELMK